MKSNQIDTTIRKNIQANISKYRKKSGLSQAELAQKIGVKNSTVSSWERGANAPDIETLFSICKLFNVTVADMFGCDTVDYNDKLTVHGFEKDLVISYRKADEVDKTIVRRYSTPEPKERTRGISDNVVYVDFT